jgi:hypothetical protein
MSSLALVFDVINAVWRSANLSVDDPGAARVWQMAIKDLPASTVVLGVEALAKSEDKFAPNPGRFRKVCLEQAEIKRQQEQRDSDMRMYAKARQTVEERSPKEWALAATNTAFVRRCVRKSFEESGVVGKELEQAVNRMVANLDHGERFKTDFDFEYVARSAALPDESTDPARPSGGWPDGTMPSHRKAWDGLRESFEIEWARHAGVQR